MDLCWQIDVSVCLGLSHFLSKENVSFNFMVAVTVPSDFGAQEKKMSLLPLFLLLSAM